MERNNSVNRVPVLRIRSIEASYKKRFVQMVVDNNSFANDMFAQNLQLNDIHVRNKLSSLVNFSMTNKDVSMTSDVVLKIMKNGEVIKDGIFTLENVTIRRPSQVQFAINTLNTLLDQQFSIYIDPANGNLITLTSEFDFELSHASFGKISDVSRGQQFEFAYILQPGSDLQYGESFIAEFDDKHLSDLQNISWTLFDEATNEIITDQYSSRFVYIAKRRTTYSLRVDYVMGNENFSTYHKGCFLVK